MKETMELERIIARRTGLEASETFDLLVHETEYYRVVMTNYVDENRVKVCTNIKEYEKEPLFDYQSKDPYLNALFIQTKFIFENFIEQEYINQEIDFDLEIEVVDVSEITVDLNSEKNRLDDFIQENSEDDLFEEDSPLFYKLGEMSEELNAISGVLDKIFIDEVVYKEIMQDDDEIRNLS